MRVIYRANMGFGCALLFWVRSTFLIEVSGPMASNLFGIRHEESKKKGLVVAQDEELEVERIATFLSTAFARFQGAFLDL